MNSRKPAHRPTKFTHETVELLLDGIRAGLPIHLACDAAGVAESTFYEWQRGEFPRGADKELKAEFPDKLTRARGVSALTNINLIANAAKEDWRAAAWILERRFPQDFGKQALEISGPNAGPIQVEAVQIQKVILQALDGHPEAKIRVAQALSELEPGQ